MDKETVNEPRKWRPWLWFCVCIGIVTMVSIGGFAWLNNVNAEKQERIVELYRVHTHESALNNAKARCVAIDSIVRKYPAKDGERAIAVLDSEIRKDEVGCNNEVLRHLLELEHNRIQEEYENLALWAGIITVVFLIFSFYSIFRGEELNRRASESIKELDSIKANAQKKRLKFSKILYGEDQHFIWKMLLCVRKACHLKYPTYNYLFRPGSIMTSSKYDKIVAAYPSYKELETIYNHSENASPLVKKYLFPRYVLGIMHSALKLCNAKEYKLLCKQLEAKHNMEKLLRFPGLSTKVLALSYLISPALYKAGMKIIDSRANK